ncbi:DUF6527 family protein [Hyphococcus sp. DH-69]|uniref:DUF6527 family protein n=1 Tax=Hyphococcus formosus TaxID=3143534 RepID=UPI00398AA811
MMGGLTALSPRFVEFVPKTLEPGVLYISIEFATTAHLCACGCGEKVVLPLHPTDWRLTYDGKAITMRPSVGNWGFPCRSHYLITGNRIEWAGDWDKEQIALGRRRDQTRRENYFSFETSLRVKPEAAPSANGKVSKRNGLLSRILKALGIGG